MTPLLTKNWCRECDSNTRPTDYESVALPPELSRQQGYYAINMGKNQADFLCKTPKVKRYALAVSARAISLAVT